MFQAAADGEIKTLWIACTNPAQSMPDNQATARPGRCELWSSCGSVCHAVEAGDYADLLLPASTWGENGHRDQQRALRQPRQQTVRPPGDAQRIRSS
jgi:assimilatory nitrate reductase catalytic subunit